MKNVAVVMGGYSSEYKISLMSGATVIKHLNTSLYHVFELHLLSDRWVCLFEEKEYPINKEDFTALLPQGKIQFDVVFNAIHGAPGENGQLQTYLNKLKIPYTGCSAQVSALTFHKRNCIAALAPLNIPCARSVFLEKGDDLSSEIIIAKVGLPCFVKANSAGSSYGVFKVYDKDELETAIAHAFEEDSAVLIESFLEGVEVSIGVITHRGKVQVLSPTEIVSSNDFFDYEAKYLGKSEEITPARISESQLKTLQTMAKKVYEGLQMRGFSRSEFIFVGDIPHFLEINTVPGLTAASLLPQQLAHDGWLLSDVFDDAIEEAIQNPYF